MAEKIGDLAKYQSMRDFRKTPEPAGTIRRLAANPTFVVQHHMARAEHYDFRLEVEGVLKSWAIPRGLSYDPKDKRLAVMTEDHPLEYAAFEGIIPKGEYGGGTVMVWDTGLYWNRSANKHGRPVSMNQAIEEGHLKVWLQGNKLSGGWALSRMKKEENGKQQWIALKHADETAGSPAPEDRSVLTRRTMDEIREAADAVWSGRGRVA